MPILTAQIFPLFLLLFAIGDFAKTPNRRASTPSLDFQFTSSQYNLSIFENSINGIAQLNSQILDAFTISRQNNLIEKIGVYLPKGYNQVQFKIVEVNLIFCSISIHICMYISRENFLSMPYLYKLKFCK